jgi:hypothetical protein
MLFFTRQLTFWFNRERFPFALLALAILFAGCLMPAQSDTWWHLRAGEEMWRSGRIMLHDEFTHTVAGQPWPNHEWLTQVLFYGIYAMGGLPLLSLVCALAVTLAWSIVWSLTSGPTLFRLALVGAGAASSSIAWSLRPQVLSMVLFAATLWILVQRRWLWILPPLFLIWANLHGAVALGGVLIAGAALAAVLARDRFLRVLIAAGALCFTATILTPLGIGLWFEIPRSLQRLNAYGVLEWRAPGLSTLVDTVFWIVGGSMILMMVIRRHTLQSVRTLTLATSTMLLFVAAARSGRHIPPFLLCAVPALAALLNVHVRRPEGDRRGAAIVPNAVLWATCALAAAFFVAHAWRAHLPQLRWDPVPAQLIAAIEGCPGRLYNRYDDGGQLIWFVKHRKVFMDSRQDPFPPELVLEHIEVERSGEYRAMFERYDIGCALTPQGSPLAARLQQDGWTERRAADLWSVYVRPGAQPPSHTRIARLYP